MLIEGNLHEDTSGETGLVLNNLLAMTEKKTSNAGVVCQCLTPIPFC